MATAAIDHLAQKEGKQWVWATFPSDYLISGQSRGRRGPLGGTDGLLLLVDSLWKYPPTCLGIYLLSNPTSNNLNNQNQPSFLHTEFHSG